MSFMDSVVILQRPLTNKFTYQCGKVVSVGLFTSCVVMCKILTAVIVFEWLILLSLVE